jgi:invasion protein IalB
LSPSDGAQQEAKVTVQNGARSSRYSAYSFAASALSFAAALVLADVPDRTHAQQAPPADKPSRAAEVGARGQGNTREIKYGDWRKFCFKPAGTRMICRTTISGTWETGQTAVRVDLIEREGDGTARLQLFLPVGLYLQAGVKLTIDKGDSYRVPYVWCLTNTCIAADLADPKTIGEMKSGQTLFLEVVDSNILTITTSLPLNQFAVVHQGAPTQIFDQAIDE